MLGTRGVPARRCSTREIYEMQVRAIVARRARGARARRRRARTSRSCSRWSPTSSELEIMRELVERVGDEEGCSAAEDCTRRDDDRAAARVLRRRPDRDARRLLLLRHQRPHPDGARLLARRRRGEVPAALHRAAGSSTAARSRRSTSPASASSCGWARGSGARPTPDLKLGICGEHGGDPDSIAFFHMAGLDYVRCSPYRVPIARVAAAQARRRAHDRWSGRRHDVRSRSPPGRREPSSSAVVTLPGRRELPAVAARRRRSYPARARRARGGRQPDCARRSSATATGSSTRKAFRRLKHKTQVFVAPEGDHYRTRLTHTLEACGIARTVARALRLNEDLDRGDRARPRPRPPAVRAHRRGRCSTSCAARALRPRLPPQRALAAGGRRARARRG